MLMNNIQQIDFNYLVVFIDKNLNKYIINTKWIN